MYRENQETRLLYYICVVGITMSIPNSYGFAISMLSIKFDTGVHPLLFMLYYQKAGFTLGQMVNSAATRS